MAESCKGHGLMWQFRNRFHLDSYVVLEPNQQYGCKPLEYIFLTTFMLRATLTPNTFSDNDCFRPQEQVHREDIVYLSPAIPFSGLQDECSWQKETIADCPVKM